MYQTTRQETDTKTAGQGDEPVLVGSRQPAQSAPRTQKQAAGVDASGPQHASTGFKLLMAAVVGLPLAGCALAAALLWVAGWMGWTQLLLLAAGWLLTLLGITVGYHRLLSHHSFQAHPAARAFWVLMGACAAQGSPLVWCAVHRKHHQFSDSDGDPHSPHLSGRGLWRSLKGFVHAHTGWLFGREFPHADLQRYVPDLLEDRLLQVVHRHYFLCVGIGLTIPFLLGGLLTWSLSGAFMGLLWGGLVRVCLTSHITWSINSVCHVFGGREFESRDASTNNLLFGLLAHGEGWHNNHHAFPTSARHGLRWWQFDLSWLIIRLMRAAGLAWNVQIPSARALQARRGEAAQPFSPPGTKR